MILLMVQKSGQPVEVGSLSQYLQGFIHPRWLGMGFLSSTVAKIIWLVVSNIFYFHPYLGKWSNLTNIFQMGWNHLLVMEDPPNLGELAILFFSRNSRSDSYDRPGAKLLRQKMMTRLSYVLSKKNGLSWFQWAMSECHIFWKSFLLGDIYWNMMALEIFVMCSVIIFDASVGWIPVWGSHVRFTLCQMNLCPCCIAWNPTSDDSDDIYPPWN